MAKTPQRARKDYRYTTPIQTRWMDNDVYAHVNNVVYYSFFDTIVNGYLVAEGALDIEKSDIIGLVVETQCNYFAPLAFPEELDGALRVAHLGNSSVCYEIGIFKKDETSPAAEGHFVHVYVDRQTRRPATLSNSLRAALKNIGLAHSIQGNHPRVPYCPAPKIFFENFRLSLGRAKAARRTQPLGSFPDALCLNRWKS